MEMCIFNTIQYILILGSKFTNAKVVMALMDKYNVTFLPNGPNTVRISESVWFLLLFFIRVRDSERKNI